MRDATCAECGSGFSYRPRQGPPPVVCSEGCRKIRLRRQSSNRSSNRMRTCAICSRSYDLDNGGSKYCSVECRNAQRAADARDRYKRTKRPAAHRITCQFCGEQATRRRSNAKYCSQKCQQRAMWRNPDVNRRKRAKRVTARRQGGSYRLADIAERDGFRCHLCGRKVDMSLSGNHKQGPTIDHLIPVSKGGADVESNVALAHRSCNCARGNKGIVQLRLAA